MAHRCPAEEIIAAYVRHTATPEERQMVESHLLGCDDCCELVSFLVCLEREPRPEIDRQSKDS